MPTKTQTKTKQRTQQAPTAFRNNGASETDRSKALRVEPGAAKTRQEEKAAASGEAQGKYVYCVIHSADPLQF